MSRSGRRLFALLICAACAWWWRAGKESTSDAAVGSSAQTERDVFVAKPAALQASDEPAYSPLADELHATHFDAAHDLVVLRGLLGQFTTTLRLAERPPLGDNADIAAALTGGNRRRLVFIPAVHPALRAGVLVDRGGVPYHFHARSADAIEVRSAGPDRMLFTADDLVSR